MSETENTQEPTPSEQPGSVDTVNEVQVGKVDTKDQGDELLSPPDNGDDADLGAEPVPAPTQAAQDDELAPPAEDEAPKEPVVEEYAGVYTPNENVDETLQVVEELSQDQLDKLAKNGALFLSNATLDELNRIEAGINRQISRAQLDRQTLYKTGAANDFIPIEVEQNGKKGIFLLTPAENDAVEIVEAYRKTLRKGVRDPFVDGDTWTNLPQIGDVRIAMGQVNQSNNKDPIVQLRYELGLSNEHSIPLWGTGMHLTMMGPGTLESLKLDTKMLLEKIDYGRGTTGFVYDANSVYLNRTVMNFLLDKVTYSTAGVTDRETLKDIILLTDLEPLALGGASTIYPDGYLLRRPCLTSKGGCGFDVDRKVNLRRTLFVSTSKLTKDQMQLMSKRSGRVDVATIRGYQGQMRPHISRLVPLKNNRALRLRVPTLAAYDRVAGAWMDRISNDAKELVSSNATREEREVYLDRVNRVALLMAYGHWVEAFVKMPEDPAADPVDIVCRATGDDKALHYKADQDIDKLLEDMASDSEMTYKVAEAIEKFINDMTIATVAVPKAQCPKCGKPVSGDETSKHPHLVNINPIEVFFTLLRHKIMTAGG